VREDDLAELNCRLAFDGINVEPSSAVHGRRFQDSECRIMRDALPFSVPNSYEAKDSYVSRYSSHSTTASIE
jgi:hypothetical protein